MIYLVNYRDAIIAEIFFLSSKARAFGGEFVYSAMRSPFSGIFLFLPPAFAVISG